VTTSPSNPKSDIWRRRLRPAVPLVVAGCMAALAMIAIAGGGAPDEPPVGRALPTTALAAEQPPAPPPLPHPSRPIRRRLVDVADREAPRPRHIDIPAIGVSAVVVPLRLAPDGSMETPERWGDTGWYEPGSEPGERGPAVIAGHVDSTSGPAVFYRLRELRRGNMVRVRRAGGSVVRFRVEGSERWPKATFPTRRVFGRTPISTLRLVTCGGSFDSSTGHYADNTIVYAVRVRERRAVASVAKRKLGGPQRHDRVRRSGERPRRLRSPVDARG
jgi:sortase (surface protein transpeptidase)